MNLFNLIHVAEHVGHAADGAGMWRGVCALYPVAKPRLCHAVQYNGIVSV